MRIVIDLQACQSGSRHRGIGRYAMAITEALIRAASHHEIILVLSGLFPETIESLKTHFSAQLSPENIRVWYAPQPINAYQEISANRVYAATMMREAFLKSLNPDIVLLTSLFESCNENTITSINTFYKIPTAVILYDLIPLIYADLYLQDPVAKAHYDQQINQLVQANLVLAISDSAKNEINTTGLSIPPERLTNISGAADHFFKKIALNQNTIANVRSRYQLHQEFLMYTGGIDFRKNIDGLIQSFAALPSTIRQNYQLAIVCAVGRLERQRFVQLIQQLGLPASQIVITGFVSDEDLVALYNLCRAFIFPSKHEGFGLPILEAMKCGAPVVASNTSSMPEVHGLPEALFDPYDPQSMTDAIENVLTNEPFRRRLIQHAETQAGKFSWDISAKKALFALEQWMHTAHSKRGSNSINRRKLALITTQPTAPEVHFLTEFYDVDIILEQTISQFLHDAHSYDRIVYLLQNTSLSTNQLKLLNSFPGVLILQDFHFGKALANLEHSEKNHCWAEALYIAYGYHALAAQFTTNQVDTYSCNKALIDNSLGIIESFPSAQQYFDAIEHCYLHAEYHPINILKHLDKALLLNEKERCLFVEALCMNQNPTETKQLWVDISHWQYNAKYRMNEAPLLYQLIHNPPPGYRVEPIFAKKRSHFYAYARTTTLALLKCPTNVLKDEIISIHPQDCYLTFSNILPHPRCLNLIQNMQRRGVIFCRPSGQDKKILSTLPLLLHLHTLFPHIEWNHSYEFKTKDKTDNAFSS